MAASTNWGSPCSCPCTNYPAICGLYWGASLETPIQGFEAFKEDGHRTPGKGVAPLEVDIRQV